LQKSHQANAQTTATMDGHNTPRKRRAAHNSSLAKWRVTCFYESLVLNQSAVLRLNICAKMPPLRQAAKRYIKLSEKFIGKHSKNLQFCRSLENLVVFRNY
jgi:hypothetical protein